MDLKDQLKNLFPDHVSKEENQSSTENNEKVQMISGYKMIR